MITISKVVHRLELLVDNPNASFMCSAGNVLDISGRFSLVSELLVDSLCSFNCSLRVEFGYKLLDEG
jgi:hypothetical protein